MHFVRSPLSLFVFILYFGASLFSIARAETKPPITICVVPLGGKTQSELLMSEAGKDVAKNGQKIRIVNLRKMGSEDSDDEWIEKACKSGIQCDVFEVNGHHAIYPNDQTGLTDDKFWGDDVNPELDVRKLFARSCDHSCDGITQKPVLMFGLGCNSLACSKPVDGTGRSPEAYAEALAHAHYSDDQIPIVLAIKYRDYGFNSRELMQLTFPNSFINGFWDSSPFGTAYADKFKNYLNQPQTKNYADFIADLIKKRDDALAENSASKWEETMRCAADPSKCMIQAQSSNPSKWVRHFDSCPGLNGDRKNLELLEQAKALRCEIREPKKKDTGYLDNLSAIREMILSDRLKNFATDIHEFVTQNGEHFSKANRTALEGKFPEEAALLKLMHDSDPMKQKVLTLYKGLLAEKKLDVKDKAYHDLLTSDLKAISELLDWGFPPKLSSPSSSTVPTDDLPPIVAKPKAGVSSPPVPPTPAPSTKPSNGPSTVPPPGNGLPVTPPGGGDEGSHGQP